MRLWLFVHEANLVTPYRYAKLVVHQANLVARPGICIPIRGFLASLGTCQCLVRLSRYGAPQVVSVAADMLSLDQVGPTVPDTVRWA